MDIMAWKFALKIFSAPAFFLTVAARSILVKEKIKDYTNDFKWFFIVLAIKIVDSWVGNIGNTAAPGGLTYIGI